MLDAVGINHDPVSGSARIVSVVPSITELLFDLQLGESLVGRTGFCFHPKAEVKHLPKLGGTKDFDLDKLRALQPTHLIVNVDENPKTLVDSAREFVPNIVVTHPMGPEDNVSLYQLMGHIFNRQTQAQQLTDDFLSSYRAALTQTNHLDQERVLYIIWKKPWMTISRDTYIARILRSVGFNQIETNMNERYPEINIENYSGNVDRILLSTEPFAFRNRDIDEIKAQVQISGKPLISLIDGEMTSWYGSRAILGYEYLASFRQKIITN